VRALGVVDVLVHVEGLLHAAGAEVDRVHDLDLGLGRPPGELVDADLVGLQAVPGQVPAAGPLGQRADAVLPPVPGDEVAARVAHHRDAHLAGQREHVGAEPVLVGPRVPRLVDPGVDAPAHVLHEGAEGTAADRGHDGGGVEDN
jgi:hypothetical protein